jgi:hypothetical protein
MSFGFSVGDFVTIFQLAWDVVQNSRRACGAHDELTREVTGLHVVLQRLDTEIKNPMSLINRTNDGRKEELGQILEGCNRLLKVTHKVLEKYNALSDEKRRTTRLWQKIRFGNGELKDMAKVRQEISTYTSAITLFLNLLSMGSQGRVEEHMENHSEELRELRKSLNWITSSLQAASGNRDGSILTSYADDDKAIWKAFRRELVEEGFSSRVLSKHKELIKDYVLELGARGALDVKDSESSIEEDQPVEGTFSPRNTGQASTNLYAHPAALPEKRFQSPGIDDFAQEIGKSEIIEEQYSKQGGLNDLRAAEEQINEQLDSLKLDSNTNKHLRRELDGLEVFVLEKITVNDLHDLENTDVDQISEESEDIGSDLDEAIRTTCEPLQVGSEASEMFEAELLWIEALNTGNTKGDQIIVEPTALEIHSYEEVVTAHSAPKTTSNKALAVSVENVLDEDFELGAHPNCDSGEISVEIYDQSDEEASLQHDTSSIDSWNNSTTKEGWNFEDDPEFHHLPNQNRDYDASDEVTTMRVPWEEGWDDSDFSEPRLSKSGIKGFENQPGGRGAQRNSQPSAYSTKIGADDTRSDTEGYEYRGRTPTPYISQPSPVTRDPALGPKHETEWRRVNRSIFDDWQRVRDSLSLENFLAYWEHFLEDEYRKYGSERDESMEDYLERKAKFAKPEIGTSDDYIWMLAHLHHITPVGDPRFYFPVPTFVEWQQIAGEKGNFIIPENGPYRARFIADGQGRVVDWRRPVYHRYQYPTDTHHIPAGRPIIPRKTHTDNQSPKTRVAATMDDLRRIIKSSHYSRFLRAHSLLEVSAILEGYTIEEIEHIMKPRTFSSKSHPNSFLNPKTKTKRRAWSIAATFDEDEYSPRSRTTRDV